MNELPGSLRLDDEPHLARRARIYCGSHDHHGPQPLFTAIVTEAQRAGIAGATVFKGIEGFGAHDRIHTSAIADIGSEVPVVIELLDSADKIDAFLVEIETWIGAALITIDDVRVAYRAPTT